MTGTQTGNDQVQTICEVVDLKSAEIDRAHQNENLSQQRETDAHIQNARELSQHFRELGRDDVVKELALYCEINDTHIPLTPTLSISFGPGLIDYYDVEINKNGLQAVCTKSIDSLFLRTSLLIRRMNPEKFNILPLYCLRSLSRAQVTTDSIDKRIAEAVRKIRK